MYICMYIKWANSYNNLNFQKKYELKLENIKIATDPPIITTTAATPQDSPNTTIELGASFTDWDIDLETIDKNVS